MSVSVATNAAIVLAYLAGQYHMHLLYKGDRTSAALVAVCSAAACGLLAVAGLNT